jgi:hypothetical protein
MEKTMKLSSEARQWLEHVAKECEKYGYRNIKLMKWDGGKDDPVHSELRELGLVKLMGTKGASWVLTQAGADWVMENRDID